GETCNGVRINGKTRQLATELQNGDQIEILTQSDAKPRAEWEKFVKTGRAKSAIRRFTRAQRVTEFSRIGKALIVMTFREHDRPFRTRSLGQSLSAFGVSRVEEVFALVGEDRLSPLRVLEKLHPDIVIDDDREARDRSRGQTTQSKLKIKGDNAGTAVTIARCCHPLPGEAIVGIFTTGKGITVHKVGCTTLSKFSDAPELWLDVSWEQDSLRTVNGRLNTVLSNEPGSLASLATVISQQGGNISNIHLTDRTPDFFRFELDLEVKDVEHMRAIIAVLQANKYVESVERSDTG
ncbi:MAG: RelA/SpoT AH/RIS domain-containing protein, partial [Alphaproteobacteria bacterium]